MKTKNYKTKKLEYIGDIYKKELKGRFHMPKIFRYLINKSHNTINLLVTKSKYRKELILFKSLKKL
jgi:hypothetical protein